MQSQIIVNQQVLETQSASLQNDFRGLADAQHETDRTLNDVITGAAVGPVVGVPPVPPAIAAVLPVSTSSTVSILDDGWSKTFSQTANGLGSAHEMC